MAGTQAAETASAPATTRSRLGVGIIGVNPTRGWASTAHIPALRALPNYEITALSAQSAESAHAAGEAFGVTQVFSDHEQLVTRPDVDLVAVTVKVPHHRELVSAALAAGKAVYCEWPLGRNVDDARAMAALAAEKGVRTIVGLQARQAPATVKGNIPGYGAPAVIRSVPSAPLISHRNPVPPATASRTWMLTVAPEASVPITAIWSGAVFVICSPVSSMVIRGLRRSVTADRSANSPRTWLSRSML